MQEPSVGLKGVLVVDNVAAGPAISGLRMAPDVSAQECLRLARAMTYKNAAASPFYSPIRNKSTMSKSRSWCAVLHARSPSIG